MEQNNESKPPLTNESDSVLANSECLTRQELMKRRASRLRRLAASYRRHYWLLMEDVRRKHRDFVWKFGNDFSKHHQQQQRYDAVNENGVVAAAAAADFNEDGGDNNNNNNNNNNSNGNSNNNGGKLGFSWCSFPNCRSKAMAMTSYCHSHILSDSKQVLYTRCQFPHKCGVDPILCGKPVLRSTVPAMCLNHLKMTRQNIQRSLKRNGASNTASNKLSSKFHLVITEYVRLIQNRRRARRLDNISKDNNPA
ncbi:hypothetical protein vseg_008513 [Gypsophila vaccaria]